MVKVFLKNNLGMLAALILAFILRFLWLDKVPPAIGGDELLYIITAKSILVSGTSLLGGWNPLSVFLFQYPKGELQAELPYFLALPSAFLPFSLVSAKFVNALLSVLTVIPIYFATKELFGKKAAVAAGFITAINPWFIFLGRTGYDTTPATFFYALSFWILLKAKGKNILWSVPVLYLAFYSYIGTKLIFLPFVLIVCLYAYVTNKKQYKKEYLIVSLLALLLVVFFVFAIKTNPVSRTSEIFTFNDPKIIETVNDTRKFTIQNPLLVPFVNKFTIYVSILTTKFFKTLSLEYLFISGDQFYAIYNHGLFYLVDFAFLFLGMFFAFAKSKRKFLLILGLLFLSVMPHVFHTAKLNDFTPHIALLFIFTTIFIGYGISEFIDSFRKKQIITFLIVIIYILSLLNFLNIYFFQFSLKGNFDFKIRELANYIRLTNGNQNVRVYTTRSGDLFKKYIIYNNLLNKQNEKIILKDFATNKFSLGNVTFYGCDYKTDLKKGLTIVDGICGNYGGNSKYIADLVDGGPDFRIYNDIVCKGIGLKQYPSGLSLSDFALENLSKEKFCQTFITSY